MTLAVLIDIPSGFGFEATYTIENLFFPFIEEVVFVENVNALKRHRKKLIYCHEGSPYLMDADIPHDTLFVLLEKWVLSYFSSFRQYDLRNIEWRNDVPCLFPLYSEVKKVSPFFVFPFDIFAASFFFLSCWQEYTIKERDLRGRIALKSTIQYKMGIVRKPIVNLYLQQFQEAICFLWGEKLNLKPMPGGGSVYIALSHDVDYIDWSVEKYIRFVIRKRRTIDPSITNVLSIARNIVGKKYIFDRIRSIELRHGIFSSYFFLSRYPSSEHCRYSKNLIRQLDEASFEVAHHISGKAIFEKRLLSEKRNFLKFFDSAKGARVHALEFEVNQLFRSLETNGYCYDSSLVFAEDLGYRTGFSYPHYIFDPLRRRPFSVLEIPLNVMDGTLFDSKYLSLSEAAAEEELRVFCQNGIPVGGAISILLHNNSFFINTDKRLKIYDRLLHFFEERDISIGTCKELFLWRKRSSVC